MWVRDNKVWYEAELIEAIRLKCQNELCYNTQPCEYNYWVEQFAKTILDLIEENEGCMHQ